MNLRDRLSELKTNHCFQDRIHSEYTDMGIDSLILTQFILMKLKHYMHNIYYLFSISTVNSILQAEQGIEIEFCGKESESRRIHI